MISAQRLGIELQGFGAEQRRGRGGRRGGGTSLRGHIGLAARPDLGRDGL